MKLAIMQPYFFPYIGYFQLMAAVDEWVIFNDIQFIDKGWINRNRILHPDIKKEWQYITVPMVKKRQFDKICDIFIKQDGKWKDRILGKLTFYKKKAPYYKQTIHFIEDCLNINEINLSIFLIRILKKIAEELEIQTTIHVQTDMKLNLGEIKHAGQWALRISEQLGASQYVNPYGGRNIFNECEYKLSGIDLSFIKPKLKEYGQSSDKFIPALSVIDVMMWNGLDEVKSMLNDYEFISGNSL